ncbi:MAG: death-on-curing family protein [Acidimicrobiaceae bacterium]|nr:death-on-curing family protein [Acidimicrobiaceae bacterium]
MTSDRYLELEDVVAMVRALGVGPIRDVGLLDSAVARPRASAFGEDAYPTLSLKAAALLHSMTKNHALINGNKRLAWLSTVVFCDLNGLMPLLSIDEAFRLVLDVANSAIDDVSLIASRLKLTQHDSQTHSSRPT